MPDPITTLKLLKKRLYTALSAAICSLFINHASAQSFTLTEANVEGSPVTTILGVGDANPGTILGVKLIYALGVQSGASKLTSTTPLISTSDVNAGIINLEVKTIGGNALTLLGGTAPRDLSTINQSLYAAVLTVALNAQNVNTQYKITTNTTKWSAGKYATPIIYTGMFPTYSTVEIVVPTYLRVNQAIPAVNTLLINNFSYFRTGGGRTLSTSFDYYGTVPATVSLRATSGNPFTYVPTQAFSPLPSNNGSMVTAEITGTPGAGEVTLLSSGNKLISNATGVPLILGNKQTVNTTLGIKADLLKSNFSGAGTYTLPLTYTLSKIANSYVQGATLTTTMTSSLQVVVSKMSEISVPTTPIIFTYNSTTAYNQGLTSLMSAPMVLSSTVPYTVDVKTDGDFKSGVNSIPAGIMIIEGTPPQTGVNAVTLSNTLQRLVNGTAPVIDRNISLQYRIPPTAALLNKPAGLYTANVTFTLTAP